MSNKESNILKKGINKELIKSFKNKFIREPTTEEKKYIMYLTSLYTRDMKNILKMEMNDFIVRKSKEDRKDVEPSK